MSIFSLSSMFNRFSRWAEKQPQIRLEKTLAEMEACSKYSYESREEEFAARIKGLFKDGAVIGTAELNRALAVENSKSYWIKPGFKVSQTIVALGVTPDDETYTQAAAGGAQFLRAHLDGATAVSAAAMSYAIKSHGEDIALIFTLLDSGAKVSATVLSDAVLSQKLPRNKLIAVVQKITAAGVKVDEKHVIDAIERKDSRVALHLIDRTDTTPLQMAYAVVYDMRAVVDKLHQKGVSFDEAILKCSNKDQQTKVKQYCKAVTGKAYVDEAAYVALEEQVKALTARLDKMEAANTIKPQVGAAKAAGPRQG